MKTQNLVRQISIVGVAVSCMVLSACNKPSERPSVMNASINGKVLQISELSEVTGEKQNVYSANGIMDLEISSAELKQIKMSGTAAQKVMDKVSDEANKMTLQNHMKNGAVAFVILRDQIKIMRVVKELVTTDPETRINALAYFKKMKDLSKTSDIQAQNKLQSEINELAYMSPDDVNRKNGDEAEKFGLIEVTAIKVAKFGVMEDERTDYGERKSVQNISPKPFEMSTHLVLGDEVGAEDASAEASPTE